MTDKQLVKCNSKACSNYDKLTCVHLIPHEMFGDCTGYNGYGKRRCTLHPRAKCVPVKEEKS